MHPLLQNRRAFLMYLVAWIPLGLILGMLTATVGHMSAAEAAALTAPIVIVLAIACLSPWYVCKSLPVRTTGTGTLLAQHISASIVVAGVVVLVGRFTASGVSNLFPGIEDRYHSAAPLLNPTVTLLYLLSIALHYVMIEAQTSRRSELLAREAQLKALKAQVNPHFLFNSLNSISALTAIDASRARAMCIRLADFLRVSLRLGERETVPFGEEMELNRMYLEVEQVRFGARLRVQEDIDSACADCQIPALLIQPLVENAVKHGIALIDTGGTISMTARRENDILRFTIENPFDPDAPATRSGIGLENVRRRLEARYGHAAKMEIQAEPQRYRVILTLPMRTDA